MAAQTLTDTDVGSWADFIDLCLEVKGVSSRLSKTSKIKAFIASFDGDLKVFLQLILPKVNQRRFQMNRKRTMKLFAAIFNEDVQTLNDIDSEQNNDMAGKMGIIISHCFANSSNNFPQRNKHTILSMQQINAYLDSLSQITKESEQLSLLRKVTLKCNKRDLKWFVRELDRDLKIDAGTKTVLEAVDPKAYDSFQTKASLDYIVNKLALGGNLTIGADLLTPIKPMLASACKSYAQAFTKCKSGIIYAEIKYDGERVQIHYDGTEWKFYSRSLKPVTAYKIKDVRERVKESCPSANTLILDSEILMVDTQTGKPLPFGSMGKHKRTQFRNSVACLFVFDILYFNGASLLNHTLEQRRKLLEKEFKEIKNSVHLSQLSIIKTESDLQDLMEQMISDSQEGLVLKDSAGVYAPNKRHWLKMKRDYLEDGGLADTVDLIVVGAYKGTGRHGGLYSTFLMACLDTATQTFKTVCKVHNGLSDSQIQAFTDNLSMDDFAAETCPQWLSVTKTIEPDWLVRNPKKSPIFEVTGFEFSESKVHTATDYEGTGVSIRFPRVTKIRDDKKYKQATNWKELRDLVKTSRGDALYKKKKNGRKRKKKEIESEEKKGNESEPPQKKRRIDTNTNNNNKDSDSDGMDIDLDSNTTNNMRNLQINTTANTNNNNTSPPLIAIPASPKVMSDDRTVCQYDADCYRKNMAHFGEYQHPNKELSECNRVRAQSKEKLSAFERRKAQLETAAQINKEKQSKKAKADYEQSIKAEKDKFESAMQSIEAEFVEIKERAHKEFEEKVVPIKQNEQFELEKIEKKYHPCPH